MVLPCFGGQSSARLHKIVSIASSLAQIFPSRLGGVAMPLLLVWVPPPPQAPLITQVLKYIFSASDVMEADQRRCMNLLWPTNLLTILLDL